MSGGSGSTEPTPPVPYGFKSSPQADTGAISGTSALPSNVQSQSGYVPSQTTAAGNYLSSSTQGLNLPGAAQQTLNTAYDPQNALYAQQYQLNQDQANVVNAQNGVSGTPYGAGVVNQADTNFNIDWQNAQLQRQATGAQTAATDVGTNIAGVTAGQGLSQGAGLYSQGLDQTQIQDFLSYLSGGTSASNAQTGLYQAGVQAQQVQNQSNSALYGGIGQLAGLGVSAYGASQLGALAPLLAFSDIRLKKDITLLGRLANGLGFYRFTYKGDDVPYVGVMAQEVQEVVPEAVVRDPSGFLRVFYDMLGLPCEPYEQWVGRPAWGSL